MSEEKDSLRNGQLYDVTIIGAGIVGCFLAHKLSEYDCRVLLLDKENDVANAATMANSAIIHAGEDPEDNTLKAKLNVLGSRMYEQICEDLHVGYKKTSAFVVATNPEEMQSLAELYRRAVMRQIPAELLSKEQALEKEPNLSDSVLQVLELPTTAVVYPWEVAIALAEESALNGVKVRLNCAVTAVKKENGYYEVITSKGNYRTNNLINAAGLYSDRIAEMVLGTRPFHVTPRRGEYFVTDRLVSPVVSRVVYPAPTKAGKGILATPTVHGNLLIGPNAEAISDKEDISCTADGLNMIRRAISNMVKNVPFDKVIRNFAGLRASGNNGDFYIKEEETAKGFYQAGCIDSPGLSAAPAIAEYMVEELMGASKRWKKKETYQKRKPMLSPKFCTEEQRQVMVAQNPLYGRIVCRCEQVTEGEIVDCIHRSVGATTVKGVKKRVRPGMGRCQGGFCEPLVVDILARELGIDKMDVLYDEADSNLFKEDLN